MKKIMTLAAAMLLTATAAMAQFSAGIGYLTPNHPWTNDNLNGFYASVDYNIPIVGNLGVAPGIAYSFSGKKTENSVSIFSGRVSLREQYVSVPVNVNYALNLSSDLTVRLYAGPTFCYGLTSILKGDGSVDIKGWTIGTGERTTSLYNDSGDYKKFDILVGGGVAFDYDSSIRLSLGYNYGLLNRYDTTLIPSFHRSYLHMGIAYLF